MLRHVQKCNAVVVNQKSVELTDESECKSAGRCRENLIVEALGIKRKNDADRGRVAARKMICDGFLMVKWCWDRLWGCGERYDKIFLNLIHSDFSSLAVDVDIVFLKRCSRLGGDERVRHKSKGISRLLCANILPVVLFNSRSRHAMRWGHSQKHHDPQKVRKLTILSLEVCAY